MRLWRRREIPGQSRPDGLYFERVPLDAPPPLVAEAVRLVAEAGRWTLRTDPAEQGDPHETAILARIDDRVDALRKMLAALGQQLTEVTADRGRLAEVSADRAVTIRHMAAQLATARRALEAHHADPALLLMLAPPEEAVRLTLSQLTST